MPLFELVVPCALAVLKERTGHATSAGGLADLGIEDDESGEIAASEVKVGRNQSLIGLICDRRSV